MRKFARLGGKLIWGSKFAFKVKFKLEFNLETVNKKRFVYDYILDIRYIYLLVTGSIVSFTPSVFENDSSRIEDGGSVESVFLSQSSSIKCVGNMEEHYLKDGSLSFSQP